MNFLFSDNLLSASDFVALLKQTLRSKSIMPELYSSLPLAGMDGTLRKKYNGTDVQGLLRAKTGSLTGVQSIVGVYPSRSGDWIGVALIANHGHAIPERELANFLSAL